MMRISFLFEGETKPVIIPVDYHGTVKNWFEKILNRHEIKYKSFNFGKPWFEDMEKKLDRFIFAEGKVQWIFSLLSDDHDAIQNVLGETLDLSDKFSSCKLKIQSISLLPKPQFHNEHYFRSVAPVCASKYQNDKTIFLSPNYMHYEELIRENLLERFQKINGKLPSNTELRCELQDLHSRTILIHLEEETITKKVRGFEFAMKLSGSKELIEFAWETGIGEYTEYGLGMIDLLQ